MLGLATGVECRGGLVSGGDKVQNMPVVIDSLSVQPVLDVIDDIQILDLLGHLRRVNRT